MKFSDNKQREWDITINIGTTMRLKADGIQFHELAENKYAKYLALENDDEGLARIVWAIIRPQADEAGVSEMDFYESLDGPPTAAMWEAFSKAYFFSIRNAEIRSSLERVFQKNQAMNARMATVMEEKMTQLERIHQERVDEIMEAVTEEKLREQVDANLNASLQLSKPNGKSSD